MTADGTLITNVASGTYQSSGAVRFNISYAATAWVLVQNPNIHVWKTVTPTVQAAGGDVVFSVCVKNVSAAVSAFNVTVSDRLPAGFAYRPVGSAAPTSWQNAPTAWQITNANSMSGPWNAGWPNQGQTPDWYMRWTLPVVGPLASGCVSYTARVL